MTRKPPAILPLTPATVTVNGFVFGPRSLVWAGLRWAEAVIWEERRLSVPWCHPTDDPSGDWGSYRVRPRDERYRFEFARNGLFVLRLQP